MAMQYPRKCPHCDYMASSPQTFSYHKRTHVTIPEGTLCEGGCGQLAKFRKTNNRMVCCENSNQCPTYIEELSQRVKNDWANDPVRKEELRKNPPMAKLTENEKLAKNKRQSEARRAKRLANELTPDLKAYRRRIHTMSQYIYQEYKDIINPNNLLIGKEEYHLDHCVSKHVGWMFHIPAEYLYAKENLAVIHSKVNSSKGPKCSIHPLDLLEQLSAPQALLDEITMLIEDAQQGHLIAQLLGKRRP